MKIIYAITLLALLSLGNIQAQEWKWASHLQCPGAVNIQAILNDNSGNTYLGGTYTGGSLTIGATSITYAGTLNDGFICKFNQNGALQWLKRIAGTADDEVVSLQIVGADLYVLGNYRSNPCNFDALTLSNTGTGVNWDSFFARYSSSTGNAVSVVQVFTGASVQRTKDFVYNPYENVFAGISQFQTGGITFDTVGGASVSIPLKSAVKDLFVFTMNLTGEIIDYGVYTTSLQQAVLKFINLSQDNGYYIGGDLFGIVKFSPTDSLSSYIGTTSDMMLISIDDSLDVNWIRKGGGPGYDHVNSIISDENGFVYVTGKIESNVRFMINDTDSSGIYTCNGASDGYLMQYNQNGTYQWFDGFGGIGADNSSGLALQEDLVQYCGNFADTIIFNNDTLTSSSTTDINTSFAIYDRAGSPVSAESAGGTGAELGQEIDFNKVSGNTIITGKFDSPTLNFGSISFTNSSGNDDGFIAAYEYPFSATFSSITHVSCNGGANGRLLAKTVYGVAPYTYDWSASTGTGTFNDSVATNLTTGNYTLKITDSRAKQTTINYTITSAAALSISLDSTNVSCYSENDGTIATTVSGGTPVYSFLWTGPNVSAPTSMNQADLGPGLYKLTITDSKDCTAKDSVIITEPLAILFGNVNVIAENPNGSSNGSIDLNVSGGILPYTYSWDYEAVLMPSRTNDTLLNLSKGEYTAHVIDDNGCLADTSIIVPGEEYRVTLIKTNVLCYGDQNGIATAHIASGYNGFPSLYTFKDAADNPIITVNDSVIINLAPGWYFVTASEQGGAARVSVDSVLIEQPDTISLQFQPEKLKCYNDTTGSIGLVVNGGTPNYSFNWSEGSTDQSIVELVAGWYTVEVIDANGCQKTDSAEVVQPDSIEISIAEAREILCFGDANGRLQATVTGGTSPYSYLWDNPGATTSSLVTNLATGTYTVSISDSKNCSNSMSYTLDQPAVFEFVGADSANISCQNTADGHFGITMQGGTLPYHYSWTHTLADTNYLDNLYPNTYTVTAYDTNNCLGGAYTFTVKSPSAPLSLSEVTASHADNLCYGNNNGSLEVLASGGWGNNTYSIDGTTWTVENAFASLLAKNYTVSVKDTGNCIVNVNIEIRQPNELAVNTLSLGNAISASGSGGTSPYTYSLDMTTWQASGEFANLPAGTYTVYLTDANNCGPAASQAIIIASSLPKTFELVSSVYPNPSLGIFNILVATEGKEQIEIEVFSITGTLVYKEFHQLFGEETQVIKLDLTGNLPGVYLMKIDGVVISTKLIFE